MGERSGERCSQRECGVIHGNESELTGHMEVEIENMEGIMQSDRIGNVIRKIVGRGFYMGSKELETNAPA